MALKNHIFELIIDKLCGRVVIALYLVTDDVYLMGQLLFRIDAIENDIEQQVDSPRQVFFLDGGIEDGILLVGEGVQIAADTLQTIWSAERLRVPLKVVCSQK